MPSEEKIWSQSEMVLKGFMLMERRLGQNWEYTENLSE